MSVADSAPIGRSAGAGDIAVGADLVEVGRSTGGATSAAPRRRTASVTAAIAAAVAVSSAVPDAVRSSPALRSPAAKRPGLLTATQLATGSPAERANPATS